MTEVETDARGRAAEVRLRNARAADRPAVQALLTDARLPTAGVADQFEHGFVVAELDGAVVAAAGLETHGEDGLLRSVVVRPELRGRGVGERLALERLEWARSRGLRGVYLLTTTAAPFFTHLGFRTTSRDLVPGSIARSAEFAEICPSTATVMALTLAATRAGCCGGAPAASSPSMSLAS